MWEVLGPSLGNCVKVRMTQKIWAAHRNVLANAIIAEQKPTNGHVAPTCSLNELVQTHSLTGITNPHVLPLPFSDNS